MGLAVYIVEDLSWRKEYNFMLVIKYQKVKEESPYLIILSQPVPGVKLEKREVNCNPKYQFQ